MTTAVSATPWRALRHLDGRWIALLGHFNACIERSDSCFVAWLAEPRTLIVGTDDELDADDTLAQIVLHELCHHLCEGLASDRSDDWGLNNMTDDDLPNEYAALRLQAQLLTTPLLRTYLQPTTEHRWFFEALADAPLTDAVHADTEPRSRAIAQRGWEAFQRWNLQGLLLKELAHADAFLAVHFGGGGG